MEGADRIDLGARVFSNIPYRYRARLARIVDSDTLDVIADLGFGISYAVRLRLLGFDSPGRGQPGHAEASHFLMELLGIPEAIDPNFCFVVHTVRRDSFGCWLAHVLLPDGRTVADSMIAAGHGVSAPES